MIYHVGKFQSISHVTTSVNERYYNIQALNPISLNAIDMTISQHFVLSLFLLILFFWNGLASIAVAFHNHGELELQLFICNLQCHSSRFLLWIIWCSRGYLISFYYWAQTWFKFCSLKHSQLSC